MPENVQRYFLEMQSKNDLMPVECGIFKGTSFVRFALLREVFKKNNSKLIGFDVFNDII